MANTSRDGITKNTANHKSDGAVNNHSVNLFAPARAEKFDLQSAMVQEP
jgi:hypothetical protein